jgi:ABC-type Fe3+/spermidine/putrescine transport system ATPase subunit
VNDSPSHVDCKIDPPAARLEGVSVELGGTRILGPVDLSIEAGGHVLLVGPSGCGKTTLLRAMAGFVTPQAGTVKLGGTIVSCDGKLSVPPEKRSVGLLFQGGALWPHMNAAKTLRFALKHSGQPATSERVDELLAAVHLTGKSARRPAELSGGEKQRLSLARALATKPRMLLLDEPLGPLDAGLREELLATLGELQSREGWTMLHVTHDPEEALSYATRVLTMEQGLIVSDDTTQKATEYPERGASQ